MIVAACFVLPGFKILYSPAGDMYIFLQSICSVVLIFSI